MDIKIDITPEVIEKQVTEAIIKSSLGKHIEQSVSKAIGGYSFDKMVDKAVQETVAEMIRQELISNQELREKIKAEILGHLTQEHIHKLLTSVMDAMTNRY